VAHAIGQLPAPGLALRLADASRPPDTLYTGPLESWPTAFSPDGRWLAFYAAVGSDPGDIHFLERATGQLRHLTLPGYQRGARFSPDGRFVAYQSEESGAWQVYVRPWPGLDAQWKVSTDNGDEPLWSRDGRELFFRSGDRVLGVRVLPGAAFAASEPRELFRGPYLRDPFGDQSWDIAPDGRFLMSRLAPGATAEVRVIRNWIAEGRQAIAESHRAPR
jgi:serine/threonine-protein kinase